MPDATTSRSVKLSRSTNNSDYYNLNNKSFGTLDDDDCSHPEYYVSQAFLEKMNNDQTLNEHDKMVIQRLACRKFHIPGQTFWQDYIFWFCNNHPIFCFCFADKRHPFGKGERILNLISTLAFGLAAASCVVLWFQYEERDFNNVLVTLFNSINITSGMVALFVFSGPIHVIFDLGLFFLQACPPCRPGGLCETTLKLPNWHQQFWLHVGSNLAFLIAIASTALAIDVMLIRASVIDDGDDTDISTNINSYSFLGIYLAEVFITNFIAFPMCTFTVFSGILGCGTIPGIGGRPYQVKKHAKFLEKQRKEEEKKRMEDKKQRKRTSSRQSV